jgi:multiple sugar transport system permease protein
MSIALTAIEADYRPRLRRRRLWTRIGSIFLGIALLIWTLLPIYNMLLIALSDDGDEFTGLAWPEDWNWDSFRVVFQEDYWYLEHFWHQLGNSFYMATATMVLTVLIASLVSFALGRMRLRRAWLITNIALLTYALPTAFLLIPFVHLMRVYGLSDSLWAVVAAEVTFATPYAILVLNGFGRLIPFELDESAKVDGATPVQMYFRIYLPLMAPALVAVGVYALLLAWNEYQYQYLLISSPRNATVAVAMNQFFDSDEAPWNYMMATALIYSLPPVAIYFALRRYMVAGLTMGAVKG